MAWQVSLRYLLFFSSKCGQPAPRHSLRDPISCPGSLHSSADKGIMAQRTSGRCCPWNSTHQFSVQVTSPVPGPEKQVSSARVERSGQQRDLGGSGDALRGWAQVSSFTLHPNMNPVLPLGCFALIVRIVLTSPFFFQQWLLPESRGLCLMLSWFQNSHRDLAASWGEGHQVFVLLCGESSADRGGRLQKVREKTAFQLGFKGSGELYQAQERAFKAEETSLKGPKCEHAWGGGECLTVHCL